MHFSRIISRLDIKGSSLVKGIHLEGLRVLGEPSNFAEKYYNEGIDEIFYQDVVASLYNRNSILDLVSKTAKMISIPMTVGGGVRKIDDIYELLAAGADKVSINTACVKNPNLIKEAVKIFGSSTIVVAVEVIKEANGDYFIYTDNGREHTGINAFAWCKKVCDLGAGEILLTSIDRDGTGKGFDTELYREICTDLSIPIIAHGGASKISHIKEVICEGNAHAVCLASMLHYRSVNEFPNVNRNILDGNTSFIEKNTLSKSFKKNSIKNIKLDLISNGIETRI